MNYVFTATATDIQAVIDYYRDIVQDHQLEHVLFLAKSEDITATVFTSGKVMLQGKAARDDYLMFSEIIGFTPDTGVVPKPKDHDQPFPPEKKVRAIGSDEVGTGDFFGPVIVCAVYIKTDDYAYLTSIGVRDSKKMTDEAIVATAAKLKARLSYQLLVTDNKKYNDLTRLGFNMNKIKAYLHNHAILKLAAKHKGHVDKVIIDEFCSREHYFQYLSGKEVYENITFATGAEAKFLSVAAASIIARDAFIAEMQALNRKVGINLPFGASVAVDLIGKRIALEKGFSIFEEIAKTNFKNLDKIKSMM